MSPDNLWMGLFNDGHFNVSSILTGCNGSIKKVFLDSRFSVHCYNATIKAGRLIMELRSSFGSAAMQKMNAIHVRLEKGK